MELGASNTVNSSNEGFRAFVSYSHADSRFAHKLHRKMEAYRLPSQIRKGPTSVETGLADGRLGKIFRDREDLPASQDLSQAVKEALSSSQALIVLCSPDAKSSPWVSQEIDLFRSLHPDRPILAALIRGEPEESFPAPLLQGREPLAADLRKEGDGWRLGFLKIVAGIAGVPLDTLVQRDAQRRLHRVMAVTAGAFAALLVMIGMTVIAIQSRNEAQQQRAEAEGLVEYMLTDLRTELKGVGRLDVMTDVNKRAMDYYGGQDDLGDMPAKSLERRARILHAMGEDDEKRGDLDQALAKFTEAHRATEALLARDPVNPDRIFGHAQSEYWIGRVHELREQWPQAALKYQSYADASQSLLAIDPQNPDYLMESGWGYLNLGILKVKTRQKPDFGRAEFEKAIDRIEHALKLRPDNIAIIKEVGNANAWLADSFLLARDFDSSLAARELELASKEEWLARAPANNAAKFAVAKARYAVGYNFILLRKEKQAEELIHQSHLALIELIALEPENRVWRSFNQKIIELKTRRNQ